MTVLEIIGVSAGLIGTTTGVISLIWHILNSRPKLKLEKAYFRKGGFSDIQGAGPNHIGVLMSLRNLSHRSTTIEYVSIQIGNLVEQPILLNTVDIPKNSSQNLTFELNFNEKDLRNLFSKGAVNFEVIVAHTFGVIRKSEKGDLSTGHFTIRKI